MDLRSRRGARLGRLIAVMGNDDVETIRAADEAVTEVNRDIVLAILAEIHGVGEVQAIDAALWESFRLSGLANPLATAALRFLELPPKKALRCGQPAPST